MGNTRTRMHDHFVPLLPPTRTRKGATRKRKGEIDSPLMKYNKYAMKRAHAHVRHDRGSRLSRPYICTLFARVRICQIPSLPQSRALSYTVSSAGRLFILFSRGERRNIRQCRGVLAKLSVALGRLRFTRSCLVSPRRLRRFACSLATWIALRVLDAAPLGPGSASALAERPRENWKEGNARRA